MRSRNALYKIAAFFAQILPSSTKQALYRYPLLSNIIRSGLNQAAPEGLSEIAVAAGPVREILMQLDLKTEKDYWLGTYESELQNAIVELVNPGDIIYDIGANIGFLTLLFARETGPQGQVHAFEALPKNVARLTHNVEINQLQEKVRIVEAAAMDKPGASTFLIGPSSGMGKVKGSAGRNSVAYEKSIQVEGISIDGYLEKSGSPPPNLIKIDIEGGEILALPGMENLLHHNRPILLIELHGPEAARVTWDILIREEYRICQMAPNFPGVKEIQDLNWKSYLVAFPDD